MRIDISLDQADVEQAVKEFIERKYEMTLNGSTALYIEVKSQQNYKSEWEQATFRGRLVGTQA